MFFKLKNDQNLIGSLCKIINMNVDCGWVFLSVFGLQVKHTRHSNRENKKRPLELTQYSLCSPCHMIVRQGSSGPERAHLLILTASASVVEPREAVIQHQLCSDVWYWSIEQTGRSTSQGWTRSMCERVCAAPLLLCVCQYKKTEWVQRDNNTKLDWLWLPREMSKMEWDDLILHWPKLYFNTCDWRK